MKENEFQAKLVKELKVLFPGCIVHKGNANLKQGIPDLIILYKNKWAALECKRNKPSPSDFQNNQEYYVNLMNEMSFARVIYPENKKEVLNELGEIFKS